MNDKSLALWRIADELRANGPLDMLRDVSMPLHILKEARIRGLEITLEEALPLVEQDRRSSDSLIPPPHVIEFIVNLFEGEQQRPQSLLDTWTGIGLPLFRLIAQFRPNTITALSRSRFEHEVAQWFAPNVPIEWHLGNPTHLISELSGRYDAVVGLPPWGIYPTTERLTVAEMSFDVRDEQAALLLLKASQLLSENGTAIFALSPKFLLDRGEKRVISVLHRFGLHITAAFRLLPGTFQPQTNMEGVLVVLRRHATDQLFIGEISPDASQREALLRNYRSRKAGRAPQVGALVEHDSFTTFRQFYSRREVSELARRTTLELVEWTDAIREVKLAGKEGFIHQSDSIYLPTVGPSPAVTTLSELTLKPQNYVQIIVNPERTSAAYLAQFLSSSQGRVVRDALTTGTFIPRITKSSLVGARLPLPDLATQTAVMRTHSALTDLSSRLETLTRELWSRPQRYKEVQKQVKAMQPANSFENWLETLPFPISSILWTYQASGSVDTKREHLLFFFEALAEFLVLVMLSGYAADEAFYAQESAGWLDSDPKFRNWILKADFGGWRVLGARLAATTRRLLENAEKREILQRLFGYPSADFLSMITHKQLYGTLEQVNNYRNEWKGHSGVFSSKDRKHHLALLETNLAEVRSIMQDHWSSALLLQPGSGEYAEGVHEYQVKALMGTRSQFKQVGVQTIRPMDKWKLYLLHEGQQEPVELLPLMRLMGSPDSEANAVYFYNRATNSDVRWISYHFDQESDKLVKGDQPVLAKLVALGLVEQ